MGEEWSDLFKQGRGGSHIYYPFPDEGSYLEEAVFFMRTALEAGCHVIVLENERNIMFLQKEFGSEDKKKIHFQNNYDFYYSNGSFHPSIVADAGAELIAGVQVEGSPVCTWGNIEWGDVKEFSCHLAEYEHKYGLGVEGKGIVSVCAYDRSSLTPELHEALLEHHQFIVEDGKILPIPIYLK